MNAVDVVAYATKNYDRISKIWKRTQVFPRTFLTEGPDECYVDCIESKMRNLIAFEPGPETKYIISSDVDVVFLSSSQETWNELFSSGKKGILFMRDAVKTNLNAGFFIVEKNYFCETFKPFLEKMLLDGSWKTLKHYEQTYMNEHLPRDDWDFIPDEYTYVPYVQNNMSRVLFYHAICVPDKAHALELALKTKKYQVHLCFHDGVSTESVLYRHPYMIPYRLNSTKYFESEFFMNVDVDLSAEYVGMVTYSVTDKSKIFKTNLIRILENSTEDLIAFHPFPGERIDDVDKRHPNFMNIWKRLTEKLAVGSYECCDPMFFCNYWVAKPHVVIEYQKFLKKAVEILESDPEVYDNAHYKEGKLSKERLVEICGKPHYTYHPFVLERLICLFVRLRSVSVRYCF